MQIRAKEKVEAKEEGVGGRHHVKTTRNKLNKTSDRKNAEAKDAL